MRQASANENVCKRVSAQGDWKTPRSKKSRFSEISDVERAIDKLSSISANNSATESDNEFDHFCKSLAAQLNRMPLDRALLCQEKLLKVMTEERMYLFRLEKSRQNVSQSTPQWTYSPSPDDGMSNSITSYEINSYSETSTPTASPFTHLTHTTDLSNSVPNATQEETYAEQPAGDIISQALSTIGYR